jgi:hypothetical protein
VRRGFGFAEVGFGFWFAVVGLSYFIEVIGKGLFLIGIAVGRLLFFLFNNSVRMGQHPNLHEFNGVDVLELVLQLVDFGVVDLLGEHLPEVGVLFAELTVTRWAFLLSHINIILWKGNALVSWQP